MNDLTLHDQLRSLREPPPDSGFEARLQQALWREAQALRAGRAPARLGAARRARRWGSRIGLTTALALAASAAAAAAGGIWVMAARSEGPRTRAPVPAPAAVPGASRAARGATGTSAVAELPVTPSAAPPVPDPTIELPSDEAGPHRASTPVSEASRARGAGRGTLPAPRAASAPERTRPSDPRAAARVSSSERREPERLTAFELPELDRPGGGVRAGNGAPPRERAQPERPEPWVVPERRSLPDLPSRAAERRGARPERAERDRGARQPPGRAVARERSGRDNAERGLQRAREVRGRR